jgi:hypothetical protein
MDSNQNYQLPAMFGLQRTSSLSKRQEQIMSKYFKVSSLHTKSRRAVEMDVR